MSLDKFVDKIRGIAEALFPDGWFIRELQHTVAPGDTVSIEDTRVVWTISGEPLEKRKDPQKIKVLQTDPLMLQGLGGQL